MPDEAEPAILRKRSGEIKIRIFLSHLFLPKPHSVFLEVLEARYSCEAICRPRTE
jgi:hypothetical protein